jgi:hypothetical protein
MLTPLLYALWVVLPPLQSAIGYRMWARRLYREYPLFFAYTISQIGRFIVLFWSYHTGIRDVYRQAYLTAEAVDFVIKFGVICELFSHIFRPYDGIRQLGSTLLRWASVILLLIAVGVAAFSSGPDADRFLAGFFAMERSVAIVQGGLLFLLFILSSSLGLQWEQRTLGIALGFAVQTSVSLATFTLRAEMGTSSHDVLSLISNAGYDCAVLIWLGAMYVRKPVYQFDHRIARWDVNSWNRALLDLLRR